MTYDFYKLMHFAGIFLTFMSISTYLSAAFRGSFTDFPGKKLAGICHGIGLLLVLVGGFGLMARLNISSGWPTWIFAKLFIWFCLGGSITLIRRKPNLASFLWWGIFALGIAAAYFARYKIN